MTTLAELQGAYETLRRIFSTDLKNRINALNSQVNAGATFTEVADEISSLRREFDNAYARIGELIAQARQLDPEPAEFISQLDRSLNVNQSNNRAALARIEIQARENESNAQNVSLNAAAEDQGTGAASAGSEVSEAQQANADGANSQAPASGPEVAGPDGDIDTAQAATPSNADPSVPVDPAAPGAPGTLPPGSTEGFISDGTFRVDVTGVGDVPSAAYAGAGDGAIIEDTNNNLVSYIYKATRVVSNFRQGKFTQDIEGVQIFFQLPSRTGVRTATQVQTRQTNTAATNSPAIPQGTVEQTVTTPDSINGPVIYADQVSAEFAAFTDTGEIPASTPAPVVPFSAPASTFDAFGFSDPTADQIATVAPLITNPPTTGVAGSVLAPLTRTGNVSTTSNTAPQRGAKEY